MVGAHQSKTQATLLAMALLGASMLTSCGSMPQATQLSAPRASSAATNLASEAPAADGVQSSIAKVSAPQPQLVRTANLSLRVDSIEQAIEQSTAIARQQQGEVMNLHHQTPTAGEHHTA
ncbi:MAG TPA: hypothetical protein V6C57_21630, partial [Coleofasciculaceae cyanobacterium]